MEVLSANMWEINGCAEYFGCGQRMEHTKNRWGLHNSKNMYYIYLLHVSLFQPTYVATLGVL